ncbi:hypothetical protein ACFL2O_11220 [Thermodesulfobacteriota bacterium]
MEFPKIKRGDVFGTGNPMALGKAINFMQGIWARDSKSVYSHSGILTDEKGNTFEALWTITRQNLFEAYEGKPIVIARYKFSAEVMEIVDDVLEGNPEIDPKVIDKALKELEGSYEGKWYPGWRLFMHLIPPVAKLSVFKLPVCSELTAKYAWLIGARHGQWLGTNPDTLADEWHNWKNCEIIFEGICPVNLF